MSSRESAAAEWERELFANGADFAYPATPDIRSAVMVRLRDKPHRTGSPRRWPLAWALSAAGVGVAGALAAWPDTREAIADFLGLGVEGTRIEVVSPTPTTAQEMATEAVTDIATYSRPTTFDEAEAVLGFRPRRATSGASPEVRLVEFEDAGAAVVLRYPSFDLWQLATRNPFVQKTIATSEVVVERAMVGDVAAYWVARGVRSVTFMDPDGRPIEGSERTVDAAALIWTDAGVYFRVEGDVSLQEALAIATGLE